VPNDCIISDVLSIIEADIGSWGENNPMIIPNKQIETVEEYFDVKIPEGHRV
jgi:hypothetical protein